MTRKALLRSTDEESAIDIHVGNRIKLRRNLLGISQDRLADLSGVTFQQVQKYETGLNRVSASRMYRVARALSVEPGYFFEGLPTLDTATPEPDPMKSSRAIEVIFHFNRISESDQAAGDSLLALMRRISGTEKIRALAAG